MTDAGFDVPSSIPAGRYLVNATIDTSAPSAASFFMIPDGMTFADVQAAFAAGDETGAGLAWIYHTTVAGGAMGAPGTVAQAVIDLPPGNWVVWADDPGSAIPMSEVQVTGAMPDTLREITPTLTITATSNDTGYDFAVDGDVVAGPQLVEFYNKTDQPHFVAALVSPVPLDDEQFMGLLMMEDGATPLPDSGIAEFRRDPVQPVRHHDDLRRNEDLGRRGFHVRTQHHHLLRDRSEQPRDGAARGGRDVRADRRAVVSTCSTGSSR